MVTDVTWFTRPARGAAGIAARGRRASRSRRGNDASVASQREAAVTCTAGAAAPTSATTDASNTFSSAATTLGRDRCQAVPSSRHLYLVSLPALTIARVSVLASGAQLTAWRQYPAEPERRRRSACVCVNGAAWPRRERTDRSRETNAAAATGFPARRGWWQAARSAAPRRRAAERRQLAARDRRADRALSCVGAKRRTCLLTTATGLAGIFLFDRELETIRLVSRSADGSSATARAPGRRSTGNGLLHSLSIERLNLVCARNCSVDVRRTSIFSRTPSSPTSRREHRSSQRR